MYAFSQRLVNLLIATFNLPGLIAALLVYKYANQINIKVQIYSGNLQKMRIFLHAENKPLVIYAPVHADYNESMC